MFINSILDKILTIFKKPKPNPQFFKTYKETKSWLDDMDIRNYEINKSTLVVDVSFGVWLDDKDLDRIPVKFGKVGGGFHVNNNPMLNSLVGSPDIVDILYCSGCGIVDFTGIGKVDTIFASSLKNLTSFKGLPTDVRVLSLYDSCHNITSLDGFPNRITIYLEVSKEFKMFDMLHLHTSHLSNIMYFGDGHDCMIPSLLNVAGLHSIIDLKNTNVLNLIKHQQHDSDVNRDV